MWLEQIGVAVGKALETDLPDVEEEIYELVGSRFEIVGTRRRRPDGQEIDIFSFKQHWSSSALGFGAGGQMMTAAQTTVVAVSGVALVYVGPTLVYRVEKWHGNAAFKRDLSAHNVAGLHRAVKEYGL